MIELEMPWSSLRSWAPVFFPQMESKVFCLGTWCHQFGTIPFIFWQALGYGMSITKSVLGGSLGALDVIPSKCDPLHITCGSCTPFGYHSPCAWCVAGVEWLMHQCDCRQQGFRGADTGRGFCFYVVQVLIVVKRVFILAACTQILHREPTRCFGRSQSQVVYLWSTTWLSP